MTKAQLKAAIAAADAKGLPDDAAVVLNGNPISVTFHIQLGKFLEQADGAGAESAEVAPQLQLVQ